jgi:hypothetical protein
MPHAAFSKVPILVDKSSPPRMPAPSLTHLPRCVILKLIGQATRAQPPEAIVLLDLGRALSFLLCILSLYAVIDTAFFLTATSWEQRLIASIARVVLAACICGASGMLFRYETEPATPLSRTLPVRIFLWTLFGVIVLFFTAWFLDVYYVPLLWPNQPWLF